MECGAKIKMQKVRRILSVSLCVLAVTSAAQAAWTTTVYHTTVSSNTATIPPFATPYTWGSGGIGWDYPIQWDHEWVIPSDPDFLWVDLIDADLAIHAQLAGDKTETIHLGSPTNPNLGDLENGSNVFDVLPFESLLDGDVTVYAKLFAQCPVDYGTVILDSSDLDLTYEITKRVWVDDPPQVVPAPAALVLSGLGMTLISWLRRRGMA